MVRISPLYIILALLLIGNSASGAEARRTESSEKADLTAIQVFDGMIHFEANQLKSTPSVKSFSCKITEVTERAGVVMDPVEKEMYFLVPTYQIMIEKDKPVYYFDDDLLIYLLDNFELKLEKSAKIDEIECYAIRMTPTDPAFEQYFRIYYVAKDDFRHVRTVAHHASGPMDNLNTVIDYKYAKFSDYTMLESEIAEISNEKNSPVGTTTKKYHDYKFGVDIDVEFFAKWLEGSQPNLPSN